MSKAAWHSEQLQTRGTVGWVGVHVVGIRLGIVNQSFSLNPRKSTVPLSNEGPPCQFGKGSPDSTVGQDLRTPGDVNHTILVRAWRRGHTSRGTIWRESGRG